jgi:SAM-dependent methyltransferase
MRPGPENAMNMTLETSPQNADPDRAITFLSPPIDFQMADEWYELATAEHFWFQWRFRAIQKLLGKEGLAEPVLEIGCGNGVVRGQIEGKYGVRVDGCDVNLAALRLANPARGDLYFYDIHQRRLEWQSYFKTVVLLDTLEHIQDTRQFLESIAFHLQPGGQLLINVPALQSLFSRYDTAAGHVKRYTTAVLRQELQSAGFALVRHAYWGFSLLPVAAARKIALRFSRSDQVIRNGFQPASGLSNAFLRGLMHLECGLGLPAPLGTSLLAIARKE